MKTFFSYSLPNLIIHFFIGRWLSFALGLSAYRILCSNRPPPFSDASLSRRRSHCPRRPGLWESLPTALEPSSSMVWEADLCAHGAPAVPASQSIHRAYEHAQFTCWILRRNYHNPRYCKAVSLRILCPIPIPTVLNTLCEKQASIGSVWAEIVHSFHWHAQSAAKQMTAQRCLHWRPKWTSLVYWSTEKQSTIK